MSGADSLDYLQTGFEPSSLTVPRLRSILVSHDVAYPSGAKKAQLVEIFVDKVLPQRKKILNERARARRTSKGITDASSGEDENEDVMPDPPTPPRTRSTRKASSRYRSDSEREPDLPPRSTRKSSTRYKSESEQETLPPLRRASRSPMKKTPRPSSKHARASEDETGTDIDGVRKTSRTTSRRQAPLAQAPPVAPVIPDLKPALDILPPSRPEARDPHRRETGFTYDNPFQSGSSPPVNADRKRKSLGASASKDPARRRRRSSSNRRRKEPPQAQAEAGIHPPRSDTFEMPVTALNGLKDFDEHGVEASEEFTAEEQAELSKDLAANGLKALGPLRPKKQKGFSMKGPIWVVALTLLGGYATWYRQEKITVGYCGVGREAKQIIPAGVEVPDWMRLLAEPECESCPQHAYCGTNLETQCDADFLLKPHPLSLGGLLPLVPTCEPDGEKERKIKQVADKAVEKLRERRAGFECGGLVNEKGVKEEVGVDAKELKKEMSKKKRRDMTPAEFEELWAGAIGEIKGREEVVVVVDGTHTILSSSSLARLPLTCALKRSARLGLARYRGEIAIVTLAMFLILYTRHLFISNAKAKAQIPHLVSLTLDRLATQASMHQSDPDTVHESWISVGQLRDDVLRNEFNIRKREKIWEGVKKVVEMNANVRAAQREARNGEISRVWEWIGAVDVGDSAGRDKRKSGRVSYGAKLGGAGVVSGGSPLAGKEAGGSKWEEGRPIY